ncbi:MAG: SDR family oxidoreductase [Acidobacteria bacterium]|nr:SDR family oxidoreductase [Acidobacteriota bacterium]
MIGEESRQATGAHNDTAGNLPYGASKGAVDRIPAAVSLAEIGVTANVVNPGATDTGWISSDVEGSVLRRNLQPRVGQPDDCANLVRFLCSSQGRWISGQFAALRRQADLPANPLGIRAPVGSCGALCARTGH